MVPGCSEQETNVSWKENRRTDMLTESKHQAPV